MATVFQRDPAAPWEPIAKNSDMLSALKRLVVDYEQLQRWAQEMGSGMLAAWDKDAIKAARAAIKKAERGRT